MNLDLADVKPSVLSLVEVTLMAIVGILLLKWLVNKFDFLAFMRDAVNAV